MQKKTSPAPAARTKPGSGRNVQELRPEIQELIQSPHWQQLVKESATQKLEEMFEKAIQDFLHALPQAIEVSGAGQGIALTSARDLVARGRFTVKGAAVFDGACSVKKNLVAEGDAHLLKYVNAQGRVDVKENLAVGGRVDVEGNHRVKGNFAAEKASAFDSSLRVKGELRVDREARFEQNLDVKGDVLLTSDARLKADIAPIEDALRKLGGIRGVGFARRVSDGGRGLRPGRRSAGVIAQEVRAVCPDLVASGGPDGHLGVSYPGVTALLIEALKELHAQVRSLTERLRELEGAPGESR